MDNRRKEQNKEPTTQFYIEEPERDNKEPTTVVVYGSNKVIDRFVKIMKKTQRRIDVCVDNTRPLLAIEFKQIRDVFIDAKKRGVTIRYITEITKDNFDYCNYPCVNRYI